jgi:hypothetical protein
LISFERFPLHTFARDILKTGISFRAYLLPLVRYTAVVPAKAAITTALQEIVMPLSGMMHRISRLAFTATFIAAPATSAAFASQGPGGGPGTASGFTQLAMAVLVYGTSALVVGAGLIGAARRR